MVANMRNITHQNIAMQELMQMHRQEVLQFSLSHLKDTICVRIKSKAKGPHLLGKLEKLTPNFKWSTRNLVR